VSSLSVATGSSVAFKAVSSVVKAVQLSASVLLSTVSGPSTFNQSNTTFSFVDSGFAATGTSGSSVCAGFMAVGGGLRAGRVSFDNCTISANCAAESYAITMQRSNVSNAGVIQVTRSNLSSISSGGTSAVISFDVDAGLFTRSQLIVSNSTVFTAAPFCVTLRLMTRSRFSNVTVLLSNVSGTAKCDTSASVIALIQQAQLNAGSTMRIEKSSFATSMKAGSGIAWSVRFYFSSGIAQRSSLSIVDSRFDTVSVTCITWGLSGGSVKDNSTLSLVNTRITATCETVYAFQLEANSVAEGLFNVTGSEVTANGAQTSLFWTAARLEGGARITVEDTRIALSGAASLFHVDTLVRASFTLRRVRASCIGAQCAEWMRVGGLVNLDAVQLNVSDTRFSNFASAARLGSAASTAHCAIACSYINGRALALDETTAICASAPVSSEVRVGCRQSDSESITTSHFVTRAASRSRTLSGTYSPAGTRTNISTVTGSASRTRVIDRTQRTRTVPDRPRTTVPPNATIHPTPPSPGGVSTAPPPPTAVTSTTPRGITTTTAPPSTFTTTNRPAVPTTALFATTRPATTRAPPATTTAALPTTTRGVPQTLMTTVPADSTRAAAPSTDVDVSVSAEGEKPPATRPWVIAVVCVGAVLLVVAAAATAMVCRHRWQRRRRRRAFIIEEVDLDEMTESSGSS
jgi:hypothetical protein